MGAGHLKIGDKIKQADGTTGVVANVTTIQQTQEMFNLTVDEAHTYYVGQDGWLVHNTACDITDQVPLFGQARIGPNFQMNSGAPISVVGRSVADVAADLKAGIVKPGDLELWAFRTPDGKLVAINNRTLAAYAEAGVRPEVVLVRPATVAEARRLLEQPVIGGMLPSRSIGVTPGPNTSTVLRTVTLPNGW